MNTPSLLCNFVIELLENFLATFCVYASLDTWVVLFSIGIVEECDKFVVVVVVMNWVESLLSFAIVLLLHVATSFSTSISSLLTRGSLNLDCNRKN